jgi:hypothetical protein
VWVEVFNVQSRLSFREAARPNGSPLAEEVGGDAPSTPQTTAQLPIGGTVTGSCGRIDRDWYRVELVAGETYVFETSIVTEDPFSTADPQLMLRRPKTVGSQTTGEIIASDNDSGPGLNAKLIFTAPTSGLYWIDVGTANGLPLSYSLSLSLRTASSADVVKSDVSTTSSLAVDGAVTGEVDSAYDADWYRVTLQSGQSYLFSMVGEGDGDAALVDPYLRLFDATGAVITHDDDAGEGRNAALRFTPSAAGTYYISAEGWEDEIGGYRLALAPVAPQDPLAAIDWGTKLADTAVRVYFAKPGEVFAGIDGALTWTASEMAAAMAACATFAAVCNVTFVEVHDAASASLVMLKAPLEDLAGRGTPPPASPAVAAFDPFVSAWAQNQPGGTGFATLVHEVGHVLGLAHPHDDGGSSEVMEGVAEDFYSYGSALLNQGAFTVMSYNDGWPLGPDGYEFGDLWGASSGPMALDIAVLQRKYGAAMNRPGDDVYRLPHPVTSSAGILAIWDSGGVDTLQLAGSASAVIDLRPATLANAVGGGGYLSYIIGLAGGFTIAAGVVIENAEGGGADDVLIGNAFANRLSGAGGKDLLTGGGGDDRLDGGTGDLDAAIYAGVASGYSVTPGLGGAWLVQDLRAGAPEGLDTLSDVELVRFSDQTRFANAPTNAVRLLVAFENILRADPVGESESFLNGLIADVSLAQSSVAGALAKVVERADASTSVASLSYQFFTGKVPTGAGFDYLIDPAGPNPNNLNSAYYQSFNLENRYINFAVNLGWQGEGRAGFEAEYGALTLAQATKAAYAEIFGAAPTDAKVTALLAGGRDGYFAYYGQDDIGTKAAMVGWLLAEASKADLGMYVRANQAFLTDLADGADLNVDLVGVYGRPEYVYAG